jgi:DNA-binding NarL/FixJ family response regulator
MPISAVVTEKEVRMGAIASLLTAVPPVTGNASSNAAGTQNEPQENQPVQSQPSPSAYTVQLSEAQQVYQLYNQGLPVSQIATNLSLTVNVVNGYLNLSNGSG